MHSPRDQVEHRVRRRSPKPLFFTPNVLGRTTSTRSPAELGLAVARRAQPVLAAGLRGGLNNPLSGRPELRLRAQPSRSRIKAVGIQKAEVPKGG